MARFWARTGAECSTGSRSAPIGRRVAVVPPEALERRPMVADRRFSSPATRARRRPGRIAPGAAAPDSRPGTHRGRVGHVSPRAGACASDDRPSPRVGRNRATSASAPRRSRVRPADPGRPPRDRVRGGRCGRSGPGRSNRQPEDGPGPAIRRSHLPAEQRSESARRSGHPSGDDGDEVSSATYLAVSHRLPRR